MTQYAGADAVAGGSTSSGTVKKIASANASVTVTNPTGPTVDVEVATSPKLGGTAAATFAKKATVPSIVTAETSATGVALINGTQTILTVTVPNDGKVHAILSVALVKDVTAVLTGGTVSITWTTAAGTAQTITCPTGTASVGVDVRSAIHTSLHVSLKPGTTVTVTQTTAMTAGAAVVYAKIVVI